MGCEFTTDVKDIEMKELQEWLTANCDKLGDAVEGLTDETVGNQYAEQMSDSGGAGDIGSYAGQLAWKEEGGGIAPDNPEFMNLLTKAGPLVIGHLQTLTDASAGPGAPGGLSALPPELQPKKPENVASKLPAQGWGLVPLRAVLDKVVEVDQTKENEGAITRILLDADKISAIVNEGVDTATALGLFVEELIRAAAGGNLLTGGPSMTTVNATHGLKDMHKDSSGAHSLAGMKINVEAIKNHLAHFKTHADELLRLKKEYEDIFKKKSDAAQDEIDKIDRQLRATGRMGLRGKALLQQKGQHLREKEKWDKLLGSMRFKFHRLAGTVIAPSVAARAVTRTYKEQCLLLANVFKLAQYKINYMEKNRPKKLPYVATPTTKETPAGANPAATSNACLMAHREPWGFMNQLVQDPSYTTLLNIPTSYLSQLSPMIRLYKIESAPGTAGKKEYQVPITFDTYHNSADELQNILKNSDKRGAGVGLKSFTFSYEGSNPFAVKKSIKAKLVIFASSFDDLLASRGSFRYADLALKTGGNLKDFLDRTNQSTDSLISNITKLNFRLKAVVGWQMPNGRWEEGKSAPGDVKKGGTTLQKAVYNSFVTLNLTPTIHEFDIDEMGRVVFTINYLAYIEDFFDQPNFNIFTNSKSEIETLKRKIQIGAWEEHCTSEESSKKKEKEAEKIDNEKNNNLNTIIGSLLRESKILFLPLPRANLGEFTRKGPFYPFDMQIGTPTIITETSQKDKLKKDFKKAIEATSAAYKESKDLTQTPIADMANTEYVSFFYLSDLLDIVLQNIEMSLQALSKDISSIPPPAGIAKDSVDWQAILESEQERLNRLLFNFEHFRLLLGPIELYDYKTGAGKGSDPYSYVSMGDLPIAVTYFMDWLTDKVLKKDRASYTLSVFLNDLLNGLVRNFLNNDSCFDLNIKQKTRVFQSVVTSYSPPDVGNDEITQLLVKARANRTKNVPYLSRLPMKEIDAWVPNQARMPLLNVMGVRDMPIPDRRDPSLEYNYLTYYAGRTQPMEHMNGSAVHDAAHGIFHYMIGKPEGLVKTIQLVKTDSPGLKEVRFEQEGYDGLSQLREVYDATIKCYGSPNIVPGTYIYVDPKGFAPTNHGGKSAYKNQNGQIIDPMLLTRYGIGGYYMVIRTENKLAAGEFNTTITAKWVAEVSKGDDNKKPGPRPTKCRVGPL